MLTAHRTSRRLGSTLLLAALACLTACEPVGGLHRRRPSLADHGDQELAATASTIGTEWVRQDGWAVAPPLDAADGATRVSALLTLISADAPLPAL
ncbi:MAG: hypothetical protein K1X94_34750, partial [Sandaracinaceae bacterium]|nr:hypothetical protein [Sandaracinaceae bacterium]